MYLHLYHPTFAYSHFMIHHPSPKEECVENSAAHFQNNGSLMSVYVTWETSWNFVIKFQFKAILTLVFKNEERWWHMQHASNAQKTTITRFLFLGKFFFIPMLTISSKTQQVIFEKLNSDLNLEKKNENKCLFCCKIPKMLTPVYLWILCILKIFEHRNWRLKWCGYLNQYFMLVL